MVDGPSITRTRLPSSTLEETRPSGMDRSITLGMTVRVTVNPGLTVNEEPDLPTVTFAIYSTLTVPGVSAGTKRVPLT